MITSFRPLTFKNSGDTFPSAKGRQFWNAGWSVGFNKWYKSRQNVFLKSTEKEKGINTWNNLIKFPFSIFLLLQVLNGSLV